MKVESVFRGAGCNRVVNNVSWGAFGLVSFNVQNVVAIFCPKTAQILTTLPGHKASVNCTLWLPNSKFAFKGTGSSTWMRWGGKVSYTLPSPCSLYLTCRITLVEMHLTSATSPQKRCYLHHGDHGVPARAVFASASSDGTVNVWEVVLPSTRGGT